MAIALVGHGAWSAGTTSVSPAKHASTAAGHMQILQVGCKPFNATINTPNGWNLVSGTDGANGSTASGIDTGSVRWATFWRIFVGGDTDPTVSITSGNVALAAIISFSKLAGTTWATPVGAKGSDTSSGTGFSLTMDANPGVQAGDMLQCFGVLPGNNATFGSPTLTITGCTIGTVVDNTEGATAQGDDLESCTSHAPCTAGTASAAAVAGWTLSANQTGGGSITRLREILEFSDTATLTDAAVISGTLGKADEVTLSDSATKSATLSKADEVTLSDNASKTATLNKADEVTLSDAETKSATLGKADEVVLSDNATKSSVLGKSDEVTLTDDISKSADVSKEDEVTLSDAISKDIDLSKSDEVVLSDNISKSIVINLSDEITLSDDLVINEEGGITTLSLSDSVTLSDEITITRVTEQQQREPSHFVPDEGGKGIDWEKQQREKLEKERIEILEKIRIEQEEILLFVQSFLICQES